MADQAGPFAGLTLNDQKIVMSAFKSLKNSFEVDYSKLAELMDWHMPNDPTKPNVKRANNAWCATRKKLFPDGFPPAAASEGGPSKAKASATPRKKKEADTPKTPRAQQKAAAKKSQETVESDEENAVSGLAMSKNGSSDKVDTTGHVKGTEGQSEETAEAEVKEADKIAASQKEVPGEDDDTPMEDSAAEEPAEEAPKTPVTPTSIADEMSAGSMSPTPVPNKAKRAVATPKSKAEPKVPKTPNTGAVGKAANAAASETPVTPVPKVTPKKRKTKAQREAEAAAGTSEGETDGDAQDSPPAKKHKAADGKAKVPSKGNEGAADDDSDSGESLGKPTPTKTPRKPSATQLAKREAKEKERMEKKAEKEKEKADKKAEKERERAEKQAAKKKGPKATSAPDGEAESSKPKTPRKTNAAQQARKAEKGETGKAKQESEDKEMDEAEAARIALAAQEEINRQANDVFNGARIDKPAKTDADASSDDESTAADKGRSQVGGFIAINGNGNRNSYRDGSSAALETVEETTEEPATDQDGDTIAVAQGETDAGETVVVGGSA